MLLQGAARHQLDRRSSIAESSIGVGDTSTLIEPNCRSCMNSRRIKSVAADSRSSGKALDRGDCPSASETNRPNVCSTNSSLRIMDAPAGTPAVVAIWRKTSSVAKSVDRFRSIGPTRATSYSMVAIACSSSPSVGERCRKCSRATLRDPISSMRTASGAASLPVTTPVRSSPT